MELKNNSKTCVNYTIVFGLMLILNFCHGILIYDLSGQQDDQLQNITGAPSSKPFIPPINSRPAPDPLEQMNLIRRPDSDKSFSSFIKKIEGSDAVFEVIVGRSRLMTLQKSLIAPNQKATPVVAVGDPTVCEFDILPNGQMIRILGRRVGTTDMSFVSSDGETFSFEIRVVYDLNLLRAYLKQIFPNSELKLVQMYEHVIVEGQSHSVTESQRIIQTIQNYLESSQLSRSTASQSQATPSNANQPSEGASKDGGNESEEGNETPGELPQVEGGIAQKPNVTATMAKPQIINLIRVPGAQQVMVKVKMVSLNRTALRQLGSTFLYKDSSNRGFGSQFATGRIASQGAGGGTNENLLGLALGSATTSFAVLPNTDIFSVFDAMRNNGVVKVLAEPNLMALHGQEASFLAGGEFPVPVPQANGGGGGGGAITIQFKEFGVLLNFTPFIMGDESIRLKVAPEVSTLESANGVEISGISVPGIATRRANTTVQLKQGQTLALAGLLQVDMNASTRRLPGLGDLPYLGPMFSNTSHDKEERELVILVTPYFVDAMNPEQVGMLPGDDIREPDDYELFALGRIESRNPKVNYRATNGWDDPLGIRKKKKKTSGGRIIGIHGFSR